MSEFISIAREYKHLATEIGKYEKDPRVASNIVSSLADGMFATPLGINIKSHKACGEQSLRTIHQGSSPAFGGLSRWVIKVLESSIAKIPWLAKDSHAVLGTLQKLRLTPDTIATQIDFKDFYLSGDTETISREISQYFSADKRLCELLHASIFFLLDHQFVLSKTLDSAFKCVSGSGIGLLHSSALSNLLFYIRVERHLCGNFQGLQCWIRYEDDCLAFCKDRPSSRRFFAALKTKAEPVFKLKCEEQLSCGKRFKFLDLEVQMSCPMLAINASQVKVVVPLCPSSGHAVSVHKSWPSSVMSRVVALSDDKAFAKAKLVERYTHANAHPDILEALSSWSLNKVPSNKDVGLQRATFTMRYHPFFRSVFYRTLRQVPPPCELGFSILAAWKIRCHHC